MAAIRDDRNRADTSQCGVECAGHIRCAGSQGQIAGDIGAGTLFKAELEGAYDKETIGLQARAISKGMRKITGVIGDQNVLFVILNQIRTKIGCVSPETLVTVRRSAKEIVSINLV